MPALRLFSLGCALALFFSSCAKKEPAPSPSSDGKPLVKVRFQTDWYAQAEHGGFYQAVAKGYYRELGIDVEIIQGGPGPTVQQKMMGGAAEFGMGSSDTTMVNVFNGLPLVMVGATMQHDPQAVLVHDDSPVKTFADMDGRALMANAGSNWMDYLKAQYHIDFKLIPMNYSLAQFMADKNFMQQCFVTAEPYYVKKNGGKSRALLIADSGFDPYRIYLTTQRYAREHPDVVRAFVAGSIRGWTDFITGDPSPAKALILKVNPQMNNDIMDYSIQAMKDYHLIEGHGHGDAIGLLTRERLQQQMDLIVRLKIIPAPQPIEKSADLSFLPAATVAAAK